MLTKAPLSLIHVELMDPQSLFNDQHTHTHFGLLSPQQSFAKAPDSVIFQPTVVQFEESLFKGDL